nr:hypothetical protein [Tissierella sp.]
MNEVLKVLDLKSIAILVVSATLFRIILLSLNSKNPNIFNFRKKIPDSWKGKWSVRWLALIILLFMFTIPLVYFNLNENLASVIGGFIIAFTEFILEKPKDINRDIYKDII